MKHPSRYASKHPSRNSLIRQNVKTGMHAVLPVVVLIPWYINNIKKIKHDIDCYV